MPKQVYIKEYHYRSRQVHNGKVYYVNNTIKWQVTDPWILNHSVKEKPRKEIYSRHFGYLHLYTKKEKLENLICPSGQSLEANFRILRNLWKGYRIANDPKNNRLEKAKEFAHRIQETEKDMGIDVSSFPFLGIFGEHLVLYDKKARAEKKIARDEDHRPLLRALRMHKIKMEVAEDEEIQLLTDAKTASIPVKYDATVPVLLEPEQDEELLVMADEIPFKKSPKCEKCGQYIMFDKVHECPELNDEIQILSDNVPFLPHSQQY